MYSVNMMEFVLSTYYYNNNNIIIKLLFIYNNIRCGETKREMLQKGEWRHVSVSYPRSNDATVVSGTKDEVDLILKQKIYQSENAAAITDGSTEQLQAPERSD